MVKKYIPLFNQNTANWILADQASGKLFEVDQVPTKETLIEAELEYKNPDRFLKVDYKTKTASLLFVGKTVEEYDLVVQEYNKD